MRAGIFTTTIEEIKELGIQDSRHFKLVFPPGTVFDFEPGQFINVLVPEAADRKAIKRSYSIASPPIWKGYIELCWKLVPGGIATGYLWSLKKGDTMQIQGPLGRFTPRTPLPETIIFVSTGTGVAPFRSIIHVLLEQKAPCQIWNIFGNRFVEDIYYKEEFEDLAKKHANFHNVFTVSRPKPGQWTGETDYVQFLLKKHFKDAQNKQIYICGLTNMINAVVATAAEIGFTKEQIHFEKYD